MGKSPYPGFPWRTCAGQGQALAGERKIWLLMAAGGCGLSWIERSCRPSNEASLWPSAGAQAGWGLEKPLPALVADMAEGERAPSHELRGSWALTQGGRPGDPGQKFPRYRQSDVAPPAPCRQICCRVSSEGENSALRPPPLHPPEWFGWLVKCLFPAPESRAALHRPERCSFHRTRLRSGRRLAERRVSRCRLGGPNSRTGPETIVQASPPRRGLAGRNEAWSGSVGVCHYIPIL